MDRSEFKKRMQSLKSYREQNPGKGYWDWRVEAFQDGGDDIPIWLQQPFKGPQYYQIKERLRQDDPAAYDRLALEVARAERPSSEIVYYQNAAGDISRGSNLQGLKSVVTPDMLPGIGDAAEVYSIVQDFKNKNYGTALAGLGLLAIPGGVAGKIYRKTKKLQNLDLNNLSEEELDKLYLKAIHDKDNNLVQQLRDFHFQKATNQVPEVLYHGAPYGGFTSFDSRAFNATVGGATAKGEKGNFFTPDLPAALRYSGTSFERPVEAKRTFIDLIFGKQPAQLHGVERIPEGSRHGRLADTEGLNPVLNRTALGNDYKRTVYPVYIKKDKVFDIDFKGEYWSQSPIDFPSKYRLEISDSNRNISSVDNFLDFNEASEAYQNLPQEYQYGHTDISDLEKQEYDLNGERSIERWTGSPKYNFASLVEQRVPHTTNGAVTYANDRGYKTIIIRNVKDAATDKVEDNYPITDVVSLEPKNIKLADPITYDDNGNIIPLSKRDNFNVSDIRYSLFPLIGGATIYGLSNNNEQQTDNFEKGGEIPWEVDSYKDGGIHIKPENRGKFTRLKERTGKSATWFKEHGTPEQKKMATFALNAKKWKHADGGEIPPELYERSDYQGSNEPVYVNPFTGKPLATGAITPAFNLEDFANFTPAGDALSVRDAFIAAKNKDLIGLGLAGLGVLPFIPTVNRNHFAERFAEMERRDAKKHEMIDDFFKQRNEVYEYLIENEEAYRRAANADRLSNSNYRDTYSEMIRQYSKGANNPDLIQPATDNLLYPTSTKAQVDPKNLDYIFLNPRYADPDELETAFQRMNPGLIRHEIGHIVDTKAGLDYTNRLSDPSRFVSDEQLKLMFPKSHKRLRNEILNKGSEIKSYMNEFRDFLMNKHEYNDRETVNGIRKKLDRYSKQFPVLNRIYDSYKSKKQFVKDYNSVPLTATESNKITV